MRLTWIMTKFRIVLAMRNRAFVFFGVIIPVAMLFLFASIFARRGGLETAYILASILAMTVMGSFWGLSQQLVIFREQGILRRFRLAPVGPGTMLASSVVSNFFLTVPAILVELGLARWTLHMSVWGNLVSMMILVTLGSATFATLGLVVASVTNSMMETQMINQILWLAFILLSGVTIPLPSLPGWIQHFALYLPATYLVTGFQRALIDHAAAMQLGTEMVSLTVSTLIAYFISKQIFRWEPEEKVAPRAKAWTVAALVPFLVLGFYETTYGHRRAEARSVFDSAFQGPHGASQQPAPQGAQEQQAPKP